MRDVDVLIQVFVEIEAILAELIQPGYQQDSDDAIVRILLTMDRPKVMAALDRLAQGYGQLRVMK